MFRAEPQSQYIPSKSQSIKPDVISDVGAGSQIRLHLPSFLNFVDPQNTYLKTSVQIVGGRGTIVPEPNAGGVAALFRNVLLRSGDGATLESIEDYNVLAATIKPFTSQSTLKHKQALFEGQQSIPTSGNSLYYGAEDDITGSSAATTGSVRARNTPEIYAKLQTGLFTGSQIIPMNILGGMRVLIDTEDANRALRLIQLDGLLRTQGSVFGDGITIAADKAIGADARTGVVGENTNYFTVKTDIDVVGERENPFVINDLLYISATNAGTDEEQLGMIVGFYADAGKIGIAYVPQRNLTVGLTILHPATTSVIYAKPDDRVAAYSSLLGKVDIGAVGTGTVDLASPTYNLSGIEMLVETVTPPDAYQAGMTKKAMSAEGVSMDILTSELHRFNQVSAEGITQIQIPTLAKRAKSILCAPVQQDNFRSWTEPSLSGIADGATSYQFQFGNELVPNRRAALSRYSQVPAKVEPLHITELQKALININQPVFSLQNVEDHFVIARAFSRYGQIASLADETISLRVDYAAGAKSKVFHNYIFKLARITISNGSVMVES
jgi:hypothetical protein